MVFFVIIAFLVLIGAIMMYTFYLGLILIVLFILLSYIIATIIINKSFKRMDFIKPNESISYDDIKDDYSRTEYAFKSKGKKLKGYLYKKNEEDKLIIYVHGMCPGHQAYLSDIISFLNRGYNVFTYDFRATGESQGKRYCGLNQQYFDLKSAIKFLKDNNVFGYKKIYLYGHSMGGYAVACVVDPIISSVVSISGFDSPIEELISVFSKGKSKFITNLARIMISIKYFIDQLLKYNIKAHRALNGSSLYTLIIHGIDDELVPFKTQSIISKRNLIYNKRIRYLEINDPMHSGHNSIIASKECVKYQQEKIDIYNKIYKETKSHAKAKEKMLEDFDPFKFNEANEELMEIIDKFYQEHTKSSIIIK